MTESNIAKDQLTRQSAPAARLFASWSVIDSARISLLSLLASFGIGTLFPMFEIGRYFGGREVGWVAVAVAIALPELTNDG